MSDIKKFAKHSAIYAVGNIANRVGAFLLLPLYTHYLTVEHYGALEMFYVTSDIISSMLSIGLAHATLRFYFEYQELEERNKVVTTTLFATAAYSILFVLLLSHFNHDIARFVFHSPGYARSFPILYGIIVFELMRQIGLAYIRAKEYSILYVVVCILQLCIQVGCNVYTVGIRKMGVHGVLTGNLISIVAGWAFTMAVVFRECRPAFDFEKMKAILKYSYPFLLTAVVGMGMQNADRIILRIFFSLREVGLYSLACKFGSLMQVLLLDPFNRNFGSYRFSIMNREDKKSILVHIHNYFMIGLFMLGLGIALYSREVLTIMTEPDFWAAYRVIPFIVLAFAISGSSYTFQTGMLYEKKTEYMVHISVFSGAANLLLYMILIPQFGSMGAAMAIMARAACEVALTYMVSNRFYPIPYELGKTVKILLAAVAFGAAAHFVPAEPWLLALSCKSALMLLFPVALYWLGCISSDELSSLKSMVAARWSQLMQFRLLKST